MTRTAVADDDRDRELAALRAEVVRLSDALGAVQAELIALRVAQLGSAAPPAWQQVSCPATAGRTTTIPPWQTTRWTGAWR